MKPIRAFFIAAAMLLGGFSLKAQTYEEDGYRYLYDYDHRVVVRKAVVCDEDYQDLWNGDYVRLNGNHKFIYRNGSRFTYGEKVWLMHNGRYIVRFGDYEYLLDEDGNRSGVYGNTVNLYWTGVCGVQRGGNWYLYTTNGYRLGSVYSNEEFSVYWNGTYVYQVGSYYYVADSDGNQIPNTYSDEEPDLLNSGNYRVYRSGHTYIIDPSGRRVQ